MRICVEFRNTVNSKLLTGISIISCILEVLFFQPFFLFFIFRNIYSLNLKYYRMCPIIAAGDHHSVVICPLTHNRATLQCRIYISTDGVPCLSAKFAVHQMVKIKHFRHFQPLTFHQQPGTHRTSDNRIRPPPRESDDPVPGCGIPPDADACGRCELPVRLSW